MTIPSWTGEYYLGSNTGDKVCTTCGEGFSPIKLKEMGRSGGYEGAGCTFVVFVVGRLAVSAEFV